MANKQDIITAIKNLDLFLRIPELKGAKPRLNNNGSPFAFAGGFNMVFQLVHNAKKWAFRVWHVPMGENKDRYVAISKYLTNSKLPYFADFIYDENGLLVNGELTDTIRMEWLDGVLLKDYIEKHLNNKAKLKLLANNFLEMTKTLREAKISHGDLQEGNILVDDSGKIRLVDYDSICIPEIEGQKELVTGLKGYQHPSRFKGGKASLKADYFSELVIYISILALSENSNLWIKYQIKDTQDLFFTENDFDNFENSEVYQDLQKLSNSIKSLTRILSSFLSASSYLNLNPIEHYLSAPEIRSFNTNKKEIIKGNSIELSWYIDNFDKISIDDRIGNVTNKNSISVTPSQTTVYKLVAENAFGKTEQELKIEVLPLPKIKEYRAKQQKIEFGKETELVWDIENIEKVELHYSGIIEILSKKGSKVISPTDETSYKIITTALDGITKEEKSVNVQVFKRVEIETFSTDNEFIVETLEIELNWKINNASSITLCSNIEREIDVTGTNKIILKPKRSQYFYLKATNDLFSIDSNKINIEVQNLPTLPRFENIIPTGKDLIPVFNLDFSENVNRILTESQKDFQKAVKKQNRFSLLNNYFKK